MTLIDSQFRSKHRSLIAKARREKIRCVKLQEDLYYTARQSKGHDRYLIYLSQTKTGLLANCRTIRGAACPKYGCCIHIAKTYLSMIAELNKRERVSHRSEAA